MAHNWRPARPLLRRAVGVLVVLGLVAALAGVAGAEPSRKAQLEAAEAEFKQLTAEIEAQQEVLEVILLETAVVAEELQQAESRYEQITEELRNTPRAPR